jgi:hypothetical protein
MKVCFLSLAAFALASFAASSSALAAGKFASPVQNTVTISFDDSTPSSTDFLGVDSNANFDSFRNWDDHYAGEEALWGSFGGSPTAIFAGIQADAGPSGNPGDNAARLNIPSNDGNGSYYAALSWEVKGLTLGNTFGGMITDTASGEIPIPTDTNYDPNDGNMTVGLYGDFQGISASANFKTDITDATFRVHIETGTTSSVKYIDDPVDPLFNPPTPWIPGNVPGLFFKPGGEEFEQSRTGARAYLVDPGDLPPNTWSADDATLDSEVADLDQWFNPSFQPYYGKGIRSYNLTRLTVTYPGGGQVGESLVDEITLSGPDVLKYDEADFNYDEMVDDQDIDLLFDAVLGLAINETLDEPPFGQNGDYAYQPVWGQDKIVFAKQALTEKYSLTRSDTDSEDLLDSADIDYLVENILGTQYGDLDLDGDKDATDLATLQGNIGMTSGAGWADGDLDGDDDVDSDDLAIFGSISIPGDYDNSGQVAQGDLDLVLLNWGKTVPPDPVPPGWVNQQPSGLIGQSALDGVLLNWGNTAGSGVAAAIPEPDTLGLMLLVTGLLASTTKRR